MKLTYFELYGRAEPIRMLLHHSKTEYENKIITAEEFGAMKASGELPCGQVPIFECDGKVMNQSVPILRYLGTKKNYYNPADADAAYDADWVMATVDDTMNKDFFMIFFRNLAAPASEEDLKIRCEMQAKCFAQLDAKLGDNKYFGGNAMNIGDFYAFTFLTSFAKNKKGAEKQAHVYAALDAEFAQFKNLVRWNETMLGEGGFAEYLAARPAGSL